MKILYVMQGAGICGGTRVIWAHCLELAKRGHHVIYGVTAGPERMDWLSGNIPVANYRRLQKKGWDIVVATGWDTWPVVASSFPKARAKWGFVQMKESMFLDMPSPNVADRAFSMPGFRVFTISAWLKEYLEEDCGQTVEAVIPNGVDTGLFYPDPMPQKRGLPIALVVGHQLNRAKNISDAAKAIRMAGDFEMWHVIMHPPYPQEIIGADKIFVNPSQDELRRIYSTADILVMSSRVEGRGCVAVEAMACKCPVVAMDHLGTDDLQEGRVLIADAGNVDHLARLIRFTMDNNEETKSRVGAAYNYVLAELRWDAVGKRLEEIYTSPAPEPRRET